MLALIPIGGIMVFFAERFQSRSKNFGAFADNLPQTREASMVNALVIGWASLEVLE
jgi:hypothetical protein